MWLSNLVTTINHGSTTSQFDVSSIHSETQHTTERVVQHKRGSGLTYTSRSREQRQRYFTISVISLDVGVGAAYVNNIWLGFLLGLAVAVDSVAIYHYLSRLSCCTTLFSFSGGHTAHTPLPLPLSFYNTPLEEIRHDRPPAYGQRSPVSSFSINLFRSRISVDLQLSRNCETN